MKKKYRDLQKEKLKSLIENKQEHLKALSLKKYQQSSHTFTSLIDNKPQTVLEKNNLKAPIKRVAYQRSQSAPV